MIKPPFTHNMSSFSKLLLLIALVVASMLFCLMIGILIAVPFWGNDVMSKMSMIENSTEPSIIALAKYFQIVSQIGTFMIPVIIFALLDGRKISPYLRLNVKPGFIIIVLSGFAILFAAPLINYISELNMQMKLPTSLSGVEQWMRSSEDKAGELTELFLNVNTLWGFLLNILMIGIIPAIGEEFLFRGVVQPLFHKWTRNIHIAVIISAFFFSAIHMQFYGFIPRFLMGMLLGYSFAWTGSLWIPIFLHFVNNSAAVFVSYLFHMGYIGNDYETIGTGEKAAFPVILSLVLTAAAVFLMYSISQKKRLQSG